MKNAFKLLGIATIIVATVFILVSCGDSGDGGIVTVTGITLNKTTLSLFVDGTETLIATVMPSKAANKKVTWESSKPLVASVLQSGLVTALSTGTTTISVTAEDGNFSVSCEVTVSPPITPGELAQKLAALSPNTLNNPHRIAITVTENNEWDNQEFTVIRDALIAASDKYVFLDFSSSPITIIPHHTFSPLNGNNESTGCETIIGVKFPDTITTISWNAFAGCKNLITINMPASLSHIGSAAFNNNGFTSISIPDTVTNLDGWNFTGPNIASINIGRGITRIEEGNFCASPKLTSVTIPSNITFIGHWAFAWSDNLTSVTILGIINENDFFIDAFQLDKEDGLVDLRDKYLAGGIGTYTRAANGAIWTKQ
jgi:hypothetical protein